MNTKKRYLSISVMALCLVMAVLLVTGSALAEDSKAQLIDMAKKVAETKQFSVTMHMGYDVVQDSGQKIEFSEIRKVTVDRPNHMRTYVEQSDGDIGQFIFDGKVMTLFSESENVYAQTDQPGDLDAAIRYAVGKMGIDMIACGLNPLWHP